MNRLKEEFLSPDDEFSPVPFWFWNDTLCQEELKRQLEDFYEKGIRGFVIHPRKGLTEANRYLSDAFLDHVEFIVQEATRLRMKVFLYDEAMYPSGSAGGRVVKTDPGLAAKGLAMTLLRTEALPPDFGPDNQFVCAVVTDPESTFSMGFDTLEAALAYRLTCPAGSWIRYFSLTNSGGTIRGVHEGEDDGEPNAPKAADLLDPRTAALFLRLTHEVYYERLKDDFGTTIISMFTDEPSILGRFPKPGLIPWTHGFLEHYISCGGRIEDIPHLFEAPEAFRRSHQIYQHAVHTRMEESYFKPISDWCSAHGIMLSGHPHSSDDIGFLSHFQLPCQDMVWRFVDPDKGNGLIGHHSTMGKCSSDSARHRGKRRNGNECFGACGKVDDPWNFPFEDMKWYLDWLFVRGVNLIIPHAFYYSLRDDRINERPPDVGPNSPWWDDYAQLATYIRRMCWLMTDSCNVTEIAVLCTEDHLPWEPVQAFYQNQIEFNYLEADLLPCCQLTRNGLTIANQNYRILLMEDGMFLDSCHQEFLQKLPSFGIPVLSFSQADTDRLKGEYASSAVSITPHADDLRVSHVIKKGIHFYLLVNEGNSDLSFQVSLPVDGKKELWDPWTGEIQPLQEPSAIQVTLRCRESMILAVDPEQT